MNNKYSLSTKYDSRGANFIVYTCIQVHIYIQIIFIQALYLNG